MPVSYEIDITRRVVFTHGYSVVTDQELLQHNKMLEADSAFDPTFNQLMDFTEVINDDVKTETINHIASKRIFNLTSLRAIVVKRGLQFGLARMFQNLRSFEDKNIQVFLNIAEARHWLGLND